MRIELDVAGIYYFVWVEYSVSLCMSFYRTDARDSITDFLRAIRADQRGAKPLNRA